MSAISRVLDNPVVAGLTVVAGGLIWPASLAYTVNTVDGPPPLSFKLGIYARCAIGLAFGLAAIGLWLIEHSWWAIAPAILYAALGWLTNDKITDWEDGCSD